MTWENTRTWCDTGFATENLQNTGGLGRKKVAENQRTQVVVITT